MIQKPRGTKDIYGVDELIYRQIFNVFEKLAKAYNIKKIITPTFESYDLFQKSSGEDSDIVTKEIYRFKDLSNRDLALKPEGTASIGRAILENKLYSIKEYNKLYYIDSMYRYEKPQKGRLRQFYQIGVEFTNELSTNSILDIIVLANTFLQKLEIDECTLNINSIGSSEEREKYILDLKKYFRKNKDQLSELSQKRIETNPLRILDDKIDSKLDIVKNAPKISKYWSKETKEEFDYVISQLKQLGIKYEINYSLVRGLDYYSNIVFEFISDSKALGSKSTIIGGGCYLNLMKNDSNNNPINGVGFGVGVERIFEILKNKNKFNEDISLDAFFLIEDEKQYSLVRTFIYNLRRDSLVVEYNYKLKKFKKLLDEALKLKAKVLVFQELKQLNSDKWTLKYKGKNQEVKLNELEKTIKKILLGE